MTNTFSDSLIMFKRCLTKNLRSPETVIMALFVPIVMMILFGFVFGGVAGDVGGFSYINFIVPGIIVQCICNASGSTGMGLHNDMSKGLFDRFRSMQIAKSAFLNGHAWMSILRSIIITIVIIGAGFAVGFRPNAGFTDWLLAAGLMILFIIAVTWVVVIFGLIVKDSEAISGMVFLLTILTFVSSGFAPPETLPTALRIFATHQPMTHVIDATRALLLGLPLGNSLWLALAWSGGITIVAFIAAVQIYKSKLTR